MRKTVAKRLWRKTQAYIKMYGLPAGVSAKRAYRVAKKIYVHQGI